MEAIQRIWQEHRRFILQVGGGFAVFLILNSCVVDGWIGNGADGLRRRNSTLESEILTLRKKVVAEAPEEKKALAELETIEKALAARFQTPHATDIPDPSRGAPQIQFNGRIGQIWTEVQAKARERNVKIPETITTNDLPVAHGSDPANLEQSAAYLEILRRALKACVELGMVQVEKPIIHEEEGNDAFEDFTVVYRRVGLTVHGPYDAFKKLFREFQNPGFLQARLLNLEARGAVGGALKGQLEFAGIFIERKDKEAAPAEAAEMPAGKDGKAGTAASPKKGSRKSGSGRKTP